MAISTDLALISQTAALNGPDGTDLPSVLDDAIRNALAMLARLRDGSGYTEAVGGVIRMYASGDATSYRFGYSTSLAKAQLTINGTDYGTTWPINVSGNAATATTAATATNATNASNASAIGGFVAADLVKRSSANGFTLSYDGTGGGRVVIYVDTVAVPAYTTWTQVASRPTDLASFTNGPGYMVDADVIRRAGSLTNLGNSGGTTITANIAGIGTVSWAAVVSDARLKQNIRPAVQDSLAKVRALQFKAFNFEPGFDDGREHKSGLIAQDLEAIDPELVENSGDWKQPRVWEMLCLALHAVQQLEARVAELEAR